MSVNESKFNELQFSPYKPFYKPPYHSSRTHTKKLEQKEMKNISKNFSDNSNNENQQNKRCSPKSFCKNCKSCEHTTKICKQPIHSYGLVVFEDQQCKNVLLMQRKDTYAYIALVESDEYLSFKEIARKITREERKKILTMNFEALWNDVMSGSRICQNKKLMYRKKSLFEFNKIKDIVNDIDDLNELAIESPWSFPKGRLKSDESTVKCAIRETCEETYLKPHEITIISDKSISETYIGDDNKTYMNIYYFAVLNELQEDELQGNERMKMSEIELQGNETRTNEFHGNETRQCKFVPVNELKTFFIENKKLNKSKKTVIKQIYDFIMTLL